MKTVPVEIPEIAIRSITQVRNGEYFLAVDNKSLPEHLRQRLVEIVTETKKFPVFRMHEGGVISLTINSIFIEPAAYDFMDSEVIVLLV
jgi:hypothetical protein